MVVRGGWGAALVLVAAISMPASAADTTRALRAISTRPAPDGTTVIVELTRPAIPRVGVVRADDGALLRLTLDLPAGTTIAPGAVSNAAVELPVARIRVGVVEPDRPRVVIETDGATDYRLEPENGTTIAVTILGARLSAAPADAAVTPKPTPAPQQPPAARIVRRSRTRPKIVLDPGHGGDDPGAEGYAIEKEMTLDIAKRLARMLRQRLDAEVVLTRDGDATLPLKARTARANSEDADLFVSIHANANPTGRLRGIETYYLDNSTDHATLRLAKLENGLDLLRPQNGEASLRYILSDLVQVGKLDDSVKLARSVQRGLVGHMKRRYPGIVDLGVKRGPFYVLVGAYMPCVLVETAFLSHPVEGRRLAREDYRADVAQGLYDGVSRFLRDLSRRRTL